MKKEKQKVGRPVMVDISPPWAEIFKNEQGQVKLAEKLGVSQTTISRWARGIHRIPTLAKKALIEICKEHSITEGLNNLK